MMKTTAASASVLLAVGLGAAGAQTATAADFCASKISGSTYYQKSFSHNGSVVATICAPGYNRAGNVYLYARGGYQNVQKYMKITVTTRNGSSSVTQSADGQFYSYVYRYAGAGAHDYHAVMFDGNGKKIVDGGGHDYS